MSRSGVEDQTYAPYMALNANFAPEAAEHPNVVGVIDAYAGDWITGTGSTVSPKGDGNQDIYTESDGVHLNAAGQAYYQSKVVAELRSILSRLP